MLQNHLLPFLFRLLGRCSLPTLHRFGGWGGLLACRLSGSMRRRIAANLALCLGRPPTPAEVRSNARETGRMMLELPFVWQRPLEEVMQHVFEVEGMEHVEAMRAEGSAMIALTPHMGCFEIASLYLGRSMPLTILYRPPKQTSVEPILRAGRERGQLSLATADLAGVRQIIKGLRQGISTGLLPDQAPGKGEGVWLPFFGKPAYTMTLAARLSEVKNTRVLLFWGERVIGHGWRLHILAPQSPIEGTLEERAAAINREIEALIRRCPAQYLWAYNRYKVPAGATPPPSTPQ
ncbi:lysophospholipid acyltransferase family protein [Uliginosibacterium aquaticum]|uniref:Lysophospholipid acyltransferase family protein n=1 Tax=Uliginosibacterium aquaticum TaxID=2731212 RepID=A0ABX2ICG6_9RHOO|nr:lysophospholipid acyltransferase family protein [Uliginosibacterium aquaticum]NSL53677.1 lysophospholipid acyltransferase family protein [Uliginosibacterium aquaticum]